MRGGGGGDVECIGETRFVRVGDVECTVLAKLFLCVVVVWVVLVKAGAKYLVICVCLSVLLSQVQFLV